MIKEKQGFTLIELMVVVLIVMIMTAVVVVSLSNARKTGRDAKRISDINMVASALQLYYADNHAYPGGLSFDQLAGPSGCLFTAIACVTGVTGQRYLEAPIVADSSYSANTYNYSATATGDVYRLYFTPEDTGKNANCSPCTGAPAPADKLYLIINGQPSSVWR